MELECPKDKPRGTDEQATTLAVMIETSEVASFFARVMSHAGFHPGLIASLIGRLQRADLCVVVDEEGVTVSFTGSVTRRMRRMMEKLN